MSALCRHSQCSHTDYMVLLWALLRSLRHNLNQVVSSSGWTGGQTLQTLNELWGLGSLCADANKRVNLLLSVYRETGGQTSTTFDTSPIWEVCLHLNNCGTIVIFSFKLQTWSHLSSTVFYLKKKAFNLFHILLSNLLSSFTQIPWSSRTKIALTALRSPGKDMRILG